jgi:hypothetical protein
MAASAVQTVEVLATEIGLEVLWRTTGIRPGQSFLVRGAWRGGTFSDPRFEQDKYYPGLDITDVNNCYISGRTLNYEVLEGWWTDARKFGSLLRDNNKMTDIGEIAAVMIQEAAR